MNGELEHTDLAVRQYHLSDILSVTTGALVSTRHMAGIYDILNFLTGDDLMTHQLPRAFDPCRAWLLVLHPTLPSVDAGITTENWKEKLAGYISAFGETLQIQPMPAGIWEHQDPMEELIRMVGKDRIIAITLPEER